MIQIALSFFSMSRTFREICIEPSNNTNLSYAKTQDCVTDISFGEKGSAFSKCEIKAKKRLGRRSFGKGMGTFSCLGRITAAVERNARFARSIPTGVIFLIAFANPCSKIDDRNFASS